MRYLLLTLILLVATGTAHAQLTFTLQPALTYEGQSVSLRFDSPTGCYPVPQIDVVRAADVVTVNLHVTDAGPCLPEWTTPRFVALGAFTAGSYQVQPYLCGNAPPPAPACLLQTTLPLTVLGSANTRHTVPALSGAIAIGLGFLVMVIGALSPRRGV